MSFVRRLNIIFFLLVAVSALSYVSFAYYPSSDVDQAAVKGAGFSGPFAFLPFPEEAVDVSSSYTMEGMTASYLLERPCAEKDHFYYETVLVDTGWSLESVESVDRFDIRVYRKGGLFLQVQTSEDVGECLVTLVGGTY
jgi:hypothetical protein